MSRGSGELMCKIRLIGALKSEGIESARVHSLLLTPGRNGAARGAENGRQQKEVIDGCGSMAFRNDYGA